MEVYYDILEMSKAAGIVTEEEIEDVKSFDGTFQVMFRFKFCLMWDRNLVSVLRTETKVQFQYPFWSRIFFPKIMVL